MGTIHIHDTESGYFEFSVSPSTLNGQVRKILALSDKRLGGCWVRVNENTIHWKIPHNLKSKDEILKILYDRGFSLTPPDNEFDIKIKS